VIFSHRIDETTELVLREQHHAWDYFKLINNNREHLRYFSGWLHPEIDGADAEKFLREYRENFAAGNHFYLGIFHNGQQAGEIGYNEFDFVHKRTNIGYWLGKQFTGKGLVIKALRAMLVDAFTVRGMNRVELTIAEENKSSHMVATKMGFVREGTLRQAEYLHDRFFDMVMYSKLKSEWLQGIEQ
jgi:ribosomal-protein-serine acetyltransferase